MFLAGSLIYPEENTGIIAKTISSSLINTNVYGTIDLNASRTCGGVAYKINSNPTKLKSYVSISHDTSNVTSRGSNNITGNMAGVAWEMSDATDVSYYGTIIGTNGSHGTTYNHDGTKNGGEGQGVFALARKISSTPTNFTFDGIIKSGDGGSGSRGLDGKGGADSTDGSAPGVLTYGDSTGGAAGDPGSVQVYEDQNFENSSSNEEDTTIVHVTIQRDALPTIAATDGSGGNNGWGGMNLQRIYYNHSDKRKRDKEFYGGTYYGHSSSTTQTRQIGFIVYNFKSTTTTFGRHVAIGPLGGIYGAASNTSVNGYKNALFFYTEDSTSWEDKTYKNPPHNTYYKEIVLYTILEYSFYFWGKQTGPNADIILEAYIIETPTNAICR